MRMWDLMEAKTEEVASGPGLKENRYVDFMKQKCMHIRGETLQKANFG